MLFMTAFAVHSIAKGEKHMTNKVIFSQQTLPFAEQLCHAYETGDWETLLYFSRQADTLQLAAFRTCTLNAG